MIPQPNQTKREAAKFKYLKKLKYNKSQRLESPVNIIRQGTERSALTACGTDSSLG